MEKINITDESGDKKYFTIIPNYILNHSTLWDREVYIQMKRITGESGTCWTSQNKLAKQCGMSVNRLKKSIKYLIEHKWIIQLGTRKSDTAGGLQEVNEYKVADLWKLNVDFYESKGVSQNDIPEPKGVSREVQRGITSEPKGVSPESYKEEPIKEEPLKNNNTTPSARDVVNYFFELKGWANKEKPFYAENKIIYSRFLRPAKDLLELCEGNLEESKECLRKVGEWAKSHDLDWGIETVFKKWYEIDFLKPKEKKPYWDGCRIFKKTENGQWFIIRNGEVLELGRSLSNSEIEWK